MEKILFAYFDKFKPCVNRIEGLIVTELKSELHTIENINKILLEKYDTIILYCQIYAGIFPGLNIFTDNYDIIKYKKLAIITIDPNNKIYKRIKKELPDNLVNNVRIFNLMYWISFKNIKFKIMMYILNGKRLIMKNAEDTITREEYKRYRKNEMKIEDFINRNTTRKIKIYCKNDTKICHFA